MARVFILGFVTYTAVLYKKNVQLRMQSQCAALNTTYIFTYFKHVLFEICFVLCTIKLLVGTGTEANEIWSMEKQPRATVSMKMFILQLSQQGHCFQKTI